MQSAVLDGGRQCNVVYRGFAKALALDTPLPTPTGWTSMGQVSVGDVLFDENGNRCRVVLATDVMVNRKCYRISFDDGESVVACEDHLWAVNDGYLRRRQVVRTSDLAEPTSAKTNRVHRYSIANARALDTGFSGEFLIHPYALGFWLGDGSSSCGQVTIGDIDAAESIKNLELCGESVSPIASTRKGNAQRYLVGTGHKLRSAEIERTIRFKSRVASGVSLRTAARDCGMSYRTACGIKYLNRRSYACNERASFHTRLDELRVLSNKHIPAAYQRAGVSSRLALLQGLMDTDGTISKSGHCAYSTKLPRLRDDVRELLAGLGIKSTIKEDVIGGRSYWKVQFTCYADMPCFRLARKLERLKQRKAVSISSSRRIVGVEEVPSVPVRCIQVDSPSRLYLCSHSMIPTHNTTISENTALWATLYGHRKYAVVLGAEAGLAKNMLDSMKMELFENDLLMEDFPEVVHAIRESEGKHQKCPGQTYAGKKTHIIWNAERVRFPCIPNAAGSGASIAAKGLTASARGLKVKDATGKNMRPDLVIIDDPQTDESARSPMQVDQRKRIIQKSVLKLGGHGSRMAAILNGTIIEADDLVDQLSDHRRHPEWQSERIPMVRSWAGRHDDLWMDRYKRLRTSYDPEIVGDQSRAHDEANQFYLANREAMDAGCVVSWPDIPTPEDEHSAIQHAYNMLIDDGPDVFASECQNQPLRTEAEESTIELKQSAIESRTNGLPHRIVPLNATHLVAHIDVQHSLLYYTAFACDNDMTGSVIDTDTYPQQPMPYFQLREARRTLAHAYPGTQPTEAVEAGLSDLITELFTRDWKREGGATQALELCLIDWADGTMQDVIARVCREHTFKALIRPAAGKGIGPGDPPMMYYKVRQGEQLGHHWLVARSAKYAVQSVTVDSNYWKEKAARSLSCLPTMRGAVRLWGDGNTDHRMTADHYSSEKGEKLTHDRTQRTGYVWKKKPNRENHRWDNLYNCLVAASMRGCGKETITKVKTAIPDHLKKKRFA